MRLGIDAREIQKGVYTGIGRPLYNFLEYFSRQDNEDTCVLFSAIPIPFDFGFKVKNVVIKEFFTFYWDQIQLTNAIKDQKIDIFYSPYYKIPLLPKCKKVNAILDLMYLAFDEYKMKLSLFSEIYYSTIGKTFANSSDIVLTCSQYSKKDLIKIYGVEKDKIKVIPLSVGEIYKPAESQNIHKVKSKLNIVSEYILYLGNFKPHKNVKNIVIAFKNICEQIPEIKLVLAGPKEYLYEELAALIKKIKIEDNVIFTGKITEEIAPGLISGAKVLVMPSFYEGFGLPCVEAMSCGVPVIVSNTTSLPEVVGDAGIKVNPFDIKGLSEAMVFIIQNMIVRNNLIKIGFEQVKNFSQELVSKQIYDVFKELTNFK